MELPGPHKPTPESPQAKWCCWKKPWGNSSSVLRMECEVWRLGGKHTGKAKGIKHRIDLFWAHLARSHWISVYSHPRAALSLTLASILSCTEGTKATFELLHLYKYRKHQNWEQFHQRVQPAKPHLGRSWKHCLSFFNLKKKIHQIFNLKGANSAQLLRTNMALIQEEITGKRYWME